MSDPLLPTTLCPILTAAAIAKPKPMEVARVVAIGAQPGIPDRQPEAEAVVCQGKQCMWFVTQRDEKGTELPGRCAVTLGVVALGMVHSAITDVTKILAPNSEKKN